MLKIPYYIPMESNKLIDYVSKRYGINLNIDGNFIENVIPDEYDYYVYKKGNKKNTLKFFKSKNKKKENNKKDLSSYTFEKYNNNPENKNKGINYNSLNGYVKNKELCDLKKDENKETIEKCEDIEKKYNNLYICYITLLEKHKINNDSLINIVLALEKIYNKLSKKMFKTITEIDYEKLISNIKRIIPSKVFINNLY